VSRHLDDVHPQLVLVARAVVIELSAFAQRLDRYDGVDHEQHRVYLGRADRLAGHLRVALSAADDAEPASALALTRSALEHHAQDLILHRGTRYVRTPQVTDDDAWAAIQAVYEAQDARWARSLAEPPTRSKTGVVTYVFRGIADAEEDPATTTDLLHPIYFEMDRYQPTAGRPADQANFDVGIIDDEHRRHFAVENQARWHQWISWTAQRKSLELNRIFVGRDLVAVDVHYAFLSGFTHATNAAYDAALGRWGTLSDRGMSDLAAELVYLYVAWLGAAELRLVTTLEDRQPPVRITGRSEIEELATAAEAACAQATTSPDAVTTATAAVRPRSGPSTERRRFGSNRHHRPHERAGSDEQREGPEQVAQPVAVLGEVLAERRRRVRGTAQQWAEQDDRQEIRASQAHGGHAQRPLPSRGMTSGVDARLNARSSSSRVAHHGPERAGLPPARRTSVVDVVAAVDTGVRRGAIDADLEVGARLAEVDEQVQWMGAVRVDLGVGGEWQLDLAFAALLGQQDAGAVAELLGMDVVSEGRCGAGHGHRADDQRGRRGSADGGAS